jgi:hypothetical protein
MENDEIDAIEWSDRTLIDTNDNVILSIDWGNRYIYNDIQDEFDKLCELIKDNKRPKEIEI